ncbi:hypothetical protein AAW51_3463 [Caldimonas brevitalea]|uniref:Uncharacterized protein n=1 Tax=Caldimonas brevitalea TaxID=413882 RepID=A0A0G3BL27_9BURK|nr:hypothetical protein AAW51_3463 [Caldimonas brevitalea]
MQTLDQPSQPRVWRGEGGNKVCRHVVRRYRQRYHDGDGRDDRCAAKQRRESAMFLSRRRRMASRLPRVGPGRRAQGHLHTVHPADVGDRNIASVSCLGGQQGHKRLEQHQQSQGPQQHGTPRMRQAQVLQGMGREGHGQRF